MDWPFDVFRDHVDDLPLVACELSGNRDYSKTPAWTTGVVAQADKLRKLGMSGYWKLD